jgi:hypothetical protein
MYDVRIWGDGSVICWVPYFEHKNLYGFELRRGEVLVLRIKNEKETLSPTTKQDWENLSL